MAKVKIQGHASGTGILTVTAPNTSTDRTITLPDATGTLLNSDGSAASLTAIPAANITGTLPAISGASLTGFTSAQMPTGSVLQVVSTTTTTKTSTSSTSYVDTAITADITPSSASNKVMVFVTIAGITAIAATSAITFGLFRDASEIAGCTNFDYNDTDPGNAEYSMSKLDSPSSTSALTYLVKFKNRVAENIDVNTYTGDDSTITLMEIAG